MKEEAGSIPPSCGTDPDDSHRPSPDAERPLIAYRLGQPGIEMALVPAPSRRAWMDQTYRRTAYHCLPMVIANQAGWFIVSGHTLQVRWSGDNDVDALRILYLEGRPPYPAVSTFGRGILTFQIPYLMRTPPGYDLLVRGPANWPRDGASPLEGVVETDWAPATFTMNWQITRPDHTVRFMREEPIAMIVPQRRGTVEQFRPVIRRLEDDPETAVKHRGWARSRREFIGATHVVPAVAWQHHYLRGTDQDGTPAPEHQRTLRLRPFRQATSEVDGQE